MLSALAEERAQPVGLCEGAMHDVVMSSGLTVLCN